MTKDLFHQAYTAMRHDMRKTLLTMLGMAWGIATVVLLLAYGDGFGDAILHIFENFGSTAVGIYPGRTSQQAGGNKAGVQIRFTDEDVEMLRNVAPLAKHIARVSDKDVTAQYGPRSFTFPVEGCDPSMQAIWNLNLAYGRFLDDQDNLSHGLYAVISSEAKDKLFSGIMPLGETIRLNGVAFQVVGVLKARMQESGDDINRTIYIPYNAMNVLQDTHFIGGIWIDSAGLDHGKLTSSIKQSMAIAHNFKPDDSRAVQVFDLQEQLSQFGIIILGLKILLTFIGALTLGIGGIGLANIMLVSVTQRTREIGVEKALGARKRDILIQFLAEAMVITGVGGLAGIVLSYIIAFSVGTLTFYSALAQHADAGDIHLVVSTKTLVIATMILGLVGIVSGMFPAVRAAQLDPIEALRYE